MCLYFLNIFSTFEQYRDNTDNRDNFGHYNHNKKCSCCNIPSAHTHKERERAASVLHTHGLSPYSTLTVKVCSLNVMILNRCQQWQQEA